MWLGLDKLDTLALNHNQLTALSAGDFEGLPRLTSLSLDYNKISYIDKEAFRGLEGRNERETRQETSLIVIIVTLDLARDNYTILMSQLQLTIRIMEHRSTTGTVLTQLIVVMSWLHAFMEYIKIICWNMSCVMVCFISFRRNIHYVPQYKLSRKALEK